MKYRDYEEFIESLNRSGARYLIIGAHAVALHARPRATKDLDIYLEPTEANAERVIGAIRDFLGTDLGLQVDDLCLPGRIIQLGVAPTRIDLIAQLSSGISFQDAWERRVTAPFGEGRVDGGRGGCRPRESLFPAAFALTPVPQSQP